MPNYKIYESGRFPIKAWVRGVHFEDGARRQLENIARLPFLHGHVAAMPDVHYGMGATVGSVIATKGAIIPAAVGVDIGCGMMAVRTTLTANDLPDSLKTLRTEIERTVPHGGIGVKGGWKKGIPNAIAKAFVSSGLEKRLSRLAQDRPDLEKANSEIHLGTLGGGNHFIEICLDEMKRVWIMLHSGSRGIGNAIGRQFIYEAREMLARRETGRGIPDKNLAWFEEGEPEFDAYVEAVQWGQDFARLNRETMMTRILHNLRPLLPPFQTDKQAVNCHHNYVQREHHLGADVWLTRKGAVAAHKGELGIIPGSMGARSFIVRGKGNEDAFCSCSHGAGRMMSRTEAKKSFTVADHKAATEGVECRKDKSVLDETPGAYKDIDAVMAAQSDLVDIVHTLKQIVCVKG